MWNQNIWFIENTFLKTYFSVEDFIYIFKFSKYKTVLVDIVESSSKQLKY